MSTATAERPTSEPTKFLMRAPCRFNNANLGDTIASLGFRINREHLNLIAADEAFCGKRVNVRMVVGAGDATQKKFWDDLQWDVQAIADIKSFRASPKYISAGLSLSMESVDVSVLAHFAKQEGWLFILKAEDLAGDEDAEGDDGQDEGTDVE